ncbi:MAG: type II toxin-antitoxin system RelE/ParE family toxin [Synergistaceae bacterium]|nr:type II toxin-antitoxin system RelE/ParE family toxin [Synergistaceae bacterium]
MSGIQVVMLPLFKRTYKKLHKNQKEAVNRAIQLIVSNPEIGVEKRGNLAGVYVYKFDCIGQEYLLAYEFDPKTRILMALGVHENFCRDVQRSI